MPLTPRSRPLAIRRAARDVRCRSRRLAAAAFALSVAACGSSGSGPVIGSGDAWRDPLSPVETRVADALSQLTLEEKVEQMHGTSLLAVRGLYLTPPNDRVGIPSFAMADGPRGVSAGTGPATAFPVGMARGATFDAALEERVGDAMGTELLARGGNVILAPTINLLYHPRWGRAQETYGEDPHALGELGAAFVRGAQRHVIATPKHFAVNNIENTRFDVSAEVSERTLRELFLPHFRRTVEAGAGAIMSAYNRVNGTYCSENGHLLRDILKDDWGFDGFVMSDWLLAVRSVGPSALAGLDVEMPQGDHYDEKLVEAVRSGEVPEATIDDAVRRILRAKVRFGLVDGTHPAPDPSVIAGPEHAALAREVARESLVLLRNEGGALPLDTSRLGSLAVVGRLADTRNLGDNGSSSVNPAYVVTPLGGIRARAGSLPVSHVATDSPSAEDLRAIAEADAAVVVVGLTSAEEGEGLVTIGDRRSMELPEAQRRLVLDVARVQPRTIVVLEGGSAITMQDWGDAPAAILVAWYPGMEGGNAIADVLFGDASPSGRLPLSWPESEAQLPPFDPVSPAVAYDLFHGYRHLDRAGIEPRWPFGFGLSYTSFRMDGLRLAESSVPRDGRVRASVDVTNTGGRAGAEVVQLYVGFPGSSVERPVRELHGFARVDLAPGETRTVEIEFPARDLATWDEARGDWRFEEIEYRVEVGSSSRDLPLATSLRLR
ncbi:MAG: beta-glucosidase [Alphaproteobacteria bacterium]